ncbi:F-actin-capping protein subunit alpha, partial [Entophlyctis luteolus]
LTLYSQIEKDLKIWRDRGGIRAEDIPNEKLPKNSAVHYDSAEKKFVGGPGAYLSNLPVLDVIAHIFSDEDDFADEKWNEKQRDFAFQIGATDEPRLVPADNGPESVTYKSMDDLNFSDRLTARRLHGFLQKPDSFVAINLDTPMFSQAKMDCYADMLMPLWYHTRIAYEQVKDVIPWAEKHNALFWRGSSTGGSYRTDSPWTTFHRTRLMEWESQRRLKYPQSVFDASKEDPLNDPSSPVPVDVAFNAYVQTDDATRRILEIMYPLKPGVWNSRAMQFKYLLVVDGNSWSGRIQTYLESNSVVLWSGLFVDWYLTSLKPWVHYVPVKLDFSDLDERLEWLRNHDDEAQQISKNARLLMGQMGRISQIQCYTALLLLEYRSLWGLPGAQSPEEFRNEVPTV